MSELVGVLTLTGRGGVVIDLQVEDGEVVDGAGFNAIGSRYGAKEEP